MDISQLALLGRPPSPVDLAWFIRGTFGRAFLLDWLCRWPALHLSQWSLQWSHQPEAGEAPEEATLEWEFISSIINQGTLISSQPGVRVLLLGGPSFQRFLCSYLLALTSVSCPATHTPTYNMLPGTCHTPAIHFYGKHTHEPLPKEALDPLPLYEVPFPTLRMLVEKL